MPLNQFGPVQFSIEGSFTEKPRLLMNGEEVAYDSLYISHSPEYTYEDVEEDGKTEKKTIPARTHLDFSVSAQIGQLEANVSYRVKANEEGKLTLVAAGKPDFMKKKDKKDEKKGKKPGDKKSEKPGDKKEEMKDGEKPDFKKFKKGKSELGEGTIVIQPDPRSRMGQQMFRDNLAESIADAGE